MSRRSDSKSLRGVAGIGKAVVEKGTVALTICLVAAPLLAQEQAVSSISREVKDIFARSAKAVVKIHGFDEHSDICGTGFFIDPTGTIYTAYAVAGDGENFTVEFAGKKYPAKQLLADVRSEIAMLKIDAVTPALPIGKSQQLEVATPVVSIGYPLDLQETPSFGMIGGFDRKYLGRYFNTTHLRVNLPVQRGEAGAPLLNLNGEVVGILTSSLENNSGCHAVPIEAAEKIRTDFVRFGEPRHGWIGANVGEAPEAVEGSRAEVTQVVDTPAAEAGIKPGDVLLQVGNTPVREPEDILDASFFLTAGDSVPITVMRGSEKLTFNVQAELHPRAKNVPLFPDGTRVPMSAGEANRAIPLNLQSAPPPKQ